MENLKSQFELFTRHTGIDIPKNVINCYLGKYGNYEFIRLFKANFDSIEKDYYPELRVLISEKFVLEILKVIYSFPKEEIYNTLFSNLEMYNSFYEGKKMTNSLDSEKLLIEELLYFINDYDYRKNQFKFPLIQKAFENLDSNPNVMKVILILYGSCGDEGGIIIRGKNLGYDSSLAHGESSEIEFNEEVFQYEGFSFEKFERIHKPILENHNR